MLDLPIGQVIHGEGSWKAFPILPKRKTTSKNISGMYRLTASETRMLTAKEKIMPDNFGRMTSDEAPQSLKDFCFPKQTQNEKSTHKHTPGPWTIGFGGSDGDDYAVITSPHRDRAICNLEPLDYVQANARLISNAPSMHDALWAIANMQVQEETDKGEVLALCMSIARIELEKCSTAGK